MAKNTKTSQSKTSKPTKQETKSTAQVTERVNTQSSSQPPATNVPNQVSDKNSTLRLTAFIFAVINTAAVGVTAGIMLLMMIIGVVASATSSEPAAAVVFIVFALICLAPLAWMIPMTVHTYKIYKGEKNNTIAFGVCTLLFLNLVSGILLLCSKKDA